MFALIYLALLPPALALVYLVKAIITGVTSPLSKLPGPWHTQYTNLALKYHVLTGQRVFYVDALHQRYGHVVRVSPDEVAVSDLESFSKIHKIGSGFVKSSWYDATAGAEPGIFAMRDPIQHAQRRKLFAKAFSNSSMKRTWETEIRRHVELAVARIKEDATRGDADVLKWWTLMTTDVIAHLSFGDSFHMLELGQQTPYIDAIQAALLGSGIRGELPWLYAIARWIPHPEIRRIVTADDVVLSHGGVAIRNMRNTNANIKNLFGQILAECDSSEKSTLTDLSVRLEAANLIVAGSDTTAVTLTYLVWAVLKNPTLQRRLEEEIDSLSDALTLEELENAPLLNSIIEETLRLYGAAPGALPRVVPRGGATFGEYFVPEGVVVSTQSYTLHRDQTVFPNALLFDGTRFLDKSSLTPAQKTALSPFGAGSRICLGLHLAWMELRLGTALFFRGCRGARLGSAMTDEMMEMDNRFLISPKGHCCNVTVVS